MIRLLHQISWVWLLALSLAACGESENLMSPPLAKQPDAASKAAYLDQLQSLGVGQYLGIKPVTTATSGDWQVYVFDVTAGAACIDGSNYQVAVRPSPSGSANTILYLEGGGACWSELTCFGAPFANRQADLPSSGRGGMFSRDDERNPVRDWNIVFAPYCDGSVHSGDNIVSYGQRQGYHWGLRNLSAAVSIMQERFPAPQQLLLTGSSAGGFGTFMAMGVVRVAYPDQYVAVLNDSGPGLENPALLDSMGADIRRNWQFEQFLPRDCSDCDQQLINLIPYALARDPDMHVGLFSYLNDSVIGTVFLQTYDNFPHLLWQNTDPIQQAYPDRFRRYFIEGMEHTILGSDQYYGAPQQPQPFYDWFAGLLERDLTRWVDRR